jgi:hypothetical protein
MPSLRIIPDAEQASWPELHAARASGRLVHLSDDADIAVAGLAHGMQSGDPSVSFTFALPDGRVVFAETSLRLLLTAADALKARHGDPRMADLSMPDITLPPDYPPRALIRAAIVSVEHARDGVHGQTFDLLRRAHNLLKRADAAEEAPDAA